jgi:hypothetical protein
MVHFPVRDPDRTQLLWHYKTPDEEAFWNENPLELRTACGATSVFTHEPIVSPFIRMPPQKPLPDTSGRVLTMAGVARLLGIPSAREARKFLQRNRLKPVRVGRKHFIAKATVEDFILDQQKAPTAAAVYVRADGGPGSRGAAVDRAVERLDAGRKSHAPA